MTWVWVTTGMDQSMGGLFLNSRKIQRRLENDFQPQEQLCTHFIFPFSFFYFI